MRLEYLKLKNFRNYSKLELQVPPGVTVLVGDNGQGKTNLIEAIYLLLRGESFRAGHTETMIKQAAAFSQVIGRFEKDSLRHDLSWNTQPGQKKIEWNGKKTTGLRLSREFPLVLFSPESLASIKEGPEFRRALIDEALISHSAASAEVLKEFKKCLRTRNRILKGIKLDESSPTETARLLDSLDGLFLPLAGELTWLRLEALREMEPELRSAFSFVLESREPVEIEYVMSRRKINGWSRSEIVDAMHQRSQELRRSELESGMTLVGPHRHDIRFLFAGKDSRYFCSQGQQRALILSYKMAQIMYHHRTHRVFSFLLLDDVLSELDPDRRTNLMSFLKEIPSQIFLTTTDLSFSLDFGDRSLSVFRIEKGVIESARTSESLRRHIDSSP